MSNIYRTPSEISTISQRRYSAGEKLAIVAERILWKAHCRAAELLDTEPGPRSRAILSAVDAQWRPAYLALSP